MPCKSGYDEQQVRAIQIKEAKAKRERELRAQIACAALTYIEKKIS